MLNFYLFRLYLKHFFILFLALEIFYVGIDFLGASKHLPNSANLKLLYSVFMLGASMKVTLPLSLIFAMIWSKIHLIRANELVVLYALGANKKDVIKPFLILSLAFSFAFMALFFTPFAYSEQKALSIKKDRYFVSITDDVFIKYNNFYIYMKQLFALQKTALDLIVFELKDNELNRVIKSQSAFFVNNQWELYDAKITQINKNSDKNSTKLEFFTFKKYHLLKGFEPKILTKVYEGKTTYSIIDAIRAISLLKKQNINTNKIFASLISTLLMPFFAPIMVVIIFFFVPISVRFFDVALFSSGAIFATLSIWGILFALSTLAQNGALNVYVGIIAPFSLLLLFAIFMYKKFT